MFFFLTIFTQQVWGYSPLRSGIAFLPMVVSIMAASAISSQLVARIGARPLMIVGPALMTGGMFWLSRLNEHDTYVGGMLGPVMLVALGMGLTFVPMSLVSLAKVPDNDTGVASSLMNAGQQVGGAIGLAVLGTVAWSAVASSTRSAAAAAKAAHPAHLSAAAMKAQQTALTNHSLAYGFSHGYLVSAGIALLALVISVALIRIKAADLSGINPMTG
jgi:predicted MFS family arabinose efflux permease